MFTRDLVTFKRNELHYGSYAQERDTALAWIAKQHDSELWTISDIAACGCCGEIASVHNAHHHRCTKHVGRNPCGVEGCTRTTAAGGGYGNEFWICGEHWRRYVPARSKIRRHYHLLRRIGKRKGWSIKMREKYWRYMRWLVEQARRKATAGKFDMSEVNKLFGWTEE